MLFRFCLYGFLKNQRYFEAFLVLVFLEKGLSFFQIGLLIGFREVAVNLLEIPSGAVADVCGRRRAMILSFVAYIASFALFGLAADIALLLTAMGLFAVGEAFRTGTHKALIFAWLHRQGRTQERTQVYGYTRSWSKYGSALSVVLAALFVYWSDSYTYIFYCSIPPYVLGIVNFMGYPADLDAPGPPSVSLSRLVRHLKDTFRNTLSNSGLRRLMGESMGFEGVFQAVRDYLQPVLQVTALALAGHWAATARMSEIQQATLLVGPVYLVLHLLSGTASRYAHRLAQRAGGEEGAARWLWGSTVVVFAVLGAAAFMEYNAGLIAAFVALYTIQNLWRPVLVSRFDAHSAEQQGATVLSIESQGRRTATMVVAPLLGWVVDAVQARGPGGPFWPVGLLGLGVGLAFLLGKGPAGRKGTMTTSSRCPNTGMKSGIKSKGNSR